MNHINLINLTLFFYFSLKLCKMIHKSTFIFFKERALWWVLRASRPEGLWMLDDSWQSLCSFPLKKINNLKIGLWGIFILDIFLQKHTDQCLKNYLDRLSPVIKTIDCNSHTSGLVTTEDRSHDCMWYGWWHHATETLGHKYDLRQLGAAPELTHSQWELDTHTVYCSYATYVTSASATGS